MTGIPIIETTLSQDSAAAFRTKTWRMVTQPGPDGERRMVDYLQWLAAQRELHVMEAPDMTFDDFLRMRFHAPNVQQYG